MEKVSYDLEAISWIKKKKKYSGKQEPVSKFSPAKGDRCGMMSPLLVKQVEARHFHGPFPPPPLTPFRMDKHTKQVIVVDSLLGTKPKARAPRPDRIQPPQTP